jgi:uncharacterized protein
MKDLWISSIHIYPVKSMGGIQLNESVVEMKGLQYDRRWMMIDESGRFVSQRENSELALFSIFMDTAGFKIILRPTGDEIIVPFLGSAGVPVKVTIWDDQCDALRYPDSLNSWFSEKLEQKVSLVFLPEESVRKIDSKYVEDPDMVSFADGYPLLFIGTASLLHLNNKLEKKIPMNRFRPNIVISGAEPHEEDLWNDFTIGNVKLKGVKACGRCIITTIDQETKITSTEPLKTLSTYRKFGNKVIFGQNVIPLNTGKIKVGDKIVVNTFHDQAVVNAVFPENKVGL